MTESRFAEGVASADRDAGNSVRPLPNGHRLGEFQLDSVLGVGGFGIVYRAFDRTLQRVVAVKEYMPAMLAARAGDYTVALRATRFAQAFDAGRAAFLNEARLLAQFDHPGLLKVLHFWESHGTAYMVMPFYEGQTLKQLADKNVRMGQPELLSMLAALLGALDVLHRAQCFHRDIALDNILMQPGGKPVLLDFGAARKLIGDIVDETAMMLKPGYAPIEQYTDDPAFKQGPWTDIYALGAVAYALITGEVPPAAVVRSIQDQYKPLASRTLAEELRYNQRVLAAIDKALALRIDDRPDSIAAFAQLLGLREASSGVFVSVPGDAPGETTSGHPASVPTVAESVAPAKASPHSERNTPTRADAEGNAQAASVYASVERVAQSKASLPGGDVPSAPGSEPLAAAAATPAPATAAAATDRVASAEAPTRTALIDLPWMRDLSAHLKRLRHAFAERRWNTLVGPALIVAVVLVIGVALLRLVIQAPVAAPPVAAQAPAVAQQAVALQHLPASTVSGATAPAPSMSASMSEPGQSVVQAASAPAAAVVAPAVEASAPGAPGTPGTPGRSTGVAASLAPQGAMQRPERDLANPADASRMAAASQPAVDRPQTVPVRFHIYPWGEVYVDGVRRGVTPPFMRMNLAPGTYDIEIRNGSLTPLHRTVRIGAGSQPVDITYTFE